MGNYIPFFRCSKILGEAGKQEVLQHDVPKILDLKLSSEQIFSEKCRWVPLSILPFCLHFALLLCSFNLSSVINFVAISAFHFCFPLWLLLSSVSRPCRLSQFCLNRVLHLPSSNPVCRHSKGDMHMLVMNCNDEYENHHFHIKIMTVTYFFFCNDKIMYGFCR